MPDESRGRTEIRVAVVARTRVYRESLERALADQPQLRVVGAATDAETAIPLVRRAAADVILVDLGRDGAAAVRQVAAAIPGVRIVALAVDEHSAETLALAEAGVAGYVTRDGSLEELLATLYGVARDELHCSPRMAGALLRRMQTLARAAEPPATADRLTAREREVLELVDAGMANKEIARHLHIEVATVKNHVHHILEKLGASRRGQAAAQLRGAAARE